jgi:5-methylcytosine-specific restriction endonuclease McrA
MSSEFTKRELVSQGKACRTCERRQPLEAFDLREDSLDGRKSVCRECRRVKASQYREQNRSFVREHHLAWRKNNREWLRQRSRKWVEANKAKRLAVQKKYRQTHKSLLAAAARARRSAAKAGDFTEEEWLAIKERHAFRCLCCGRVEPEIRLEADHVVAVEQNGPHVASNIQPLCRTCNAAKGTKATDYR